MENFDSLGLPQQLLANLKSIHFTKPTPIQAMAIPAALAGRDILGSAQTGTGKTAAFTIPLLARMMEDPNGTALIMTPTRELAVQVVQAINSMIERDSDIRTALLIGGESMFPQLKRLKTNPRVFVGTPGRITDHLKRGSLKLKDTNYLVLDETDRMLDMGFGPQIDKVLNFMPADRQTLMFSATLPDHITKLAARYMNNPERIAAGSVTKPIEKIKQEIVNTDTAKKYEALLAELYARTGSIIIFVKTKYGADRLATKLSRDDHPSEAIHGDLKQSRRDRVIREFRAQEYRILVATDVAARGLDIPHIEHVINYDLPQNAEDYIHRIGRTARAGAEGSAVALLTPEDGGKWRIIQRLLNPGEKHGRDDGDRQHRGGARGNKSGKKGFGGKKSFGDKRRDERPQGGKHKRFDSASPYANAAEKRGEGFRDRKPRSDRPEGGQRFEKREEGTSSEGRSFKPRGDRPEGGKRFEKREGGFEGRKSFGDKPRGERSEGSFEGRKSYKPRGDRPEGGNRYEKREDGYEGRKTFGDKPRGERTEGGFEGRKSYKPRGDRSEGGQRYEKREGGYEGRKSFGDKPRGERSEGGFEGRKSYKPRGDRPEGGQRFEKREGGYEGRKTFGDKPRGERSEGGFEGRKSFKPRGDRPEGGKRFEKRDDGFKPRGDRPESGKRFEKRDGEKRDGGYKGKKTFGGGKPFKGGKPGGKPYGGKPKRDNAA